MISAQETNEEGLLILCVVRDVTDGMRAEQKFLGVPHSY
jgi:hypothetical protein